MHFFSVTLDHGRGPINVLVVQYANGQSIRTLFDLLYNDPAASRRRASAIILRPDVCEHFRPGQLARARTGKPGRAGAFLDAVRESSKPEARSFARVEDVPVFVLHSNAFAIEISGNINTTAKVVSLIEGHMADPRTIEAIRATEFEHLVARSKALLMPVEGAYYAPPSQKAVRAFLRVGNIQFSSRAVDAIAFWLLPHMAKTRGLLIDTWSVSSIAFNVSRILTLYDGRRPIPVEMLSRYQDNSNEAKAALHEALDRLVSESDGIENITDADSSLDTDAPGFTASGGFFDGIDTAAPLEQPGVAGGNAENSPATQAGEMSVLGAEGAATGSDQQFAAEQNADAPTVSTEFAPVGDDEGQPDEDGGIALTCLISATQTGSLVGVLQREIELAALPISMNFVALFRLGSTGDLPALCDMSSDERFEPLNPDAIEERVPINIDAQVYFPLNYKDVDHFIRSAQTKVLRSFLNNFPGVSLFSAHHDQRSDGATRHHAVHLDTSKLIEQPSFQTALRIQLSKLNPLPSVVLTPPHEAGKALGALAATMIAGMSDSEVLHLEHPTLALRHTSAFQDADEAVRRALAELKESQSLLILDDCFVTGDRLTRYQSRLRQLDVRARLHYLVGCARAEDSAQWTECVTMLSYRDPADQKLHATNTVNALYEFNLPNWQEDACPWCAEAEWLRGLIEKHPDAPEALKARLKRLLSSEDGLVDDLFLVEPGASPLTLYSGSLFADAGATQATVFAAAAAALQRLRTVALAAKPVLGPRRYPISTVLRHTEYLRSVYTDSILRAAILRAACPEELTYMRSQSEELRNEMASTLLAATQADINDLTLELLVAHAGKKIRLEDAATPQGVVAAALWPLL